MLLLHNVEQAEPNLAKERSEVVLLNRANILRLSDDPIATSSIMETADPNFPNDRKDIVDAKLIASRTESELATFILS
jgi:hypothetical protein